MRDSRLETQVDTSHTGGSVHPRAPLVYLLYDRKCNYLYFVQLEPERNRFSGLSTSQQLDEIWGLVTRLGPLATQVLQLEDVLGKLWLE